MQGSVRHDLPYGESAGTDKVHQRGPFRQRQVFLVQCLFDQIADELVDLNQSSFVDEISFLEGYLGRLRVENAQESQHVPATPPLAATTITDCDDVDMSSEETEEDVNDDKNELVASLPAEEQTEEDEEDLDGGRNRETAASVTMPIQEIACVDIVIMSSRIEKLSLGELCDVLPTIQEKYVDAVDALVELGYDCSYVADAVPYLLPEKLISEEEDDSEEEENSTVTRRAAKMSATISSPNSYVVIDGVGSYTIQQLRAMLAVYNTNRDCEMGRRYLAWLQSVKRSPTSLNALQDAKQHRPNAVVKWHARTGLLYSHLYRLVQCEWFVTSIFEALGTVWARYGAHTILLPTVSRRGATFTIPEQVKEARDSAARWILLPINAEDVHWTGIIIDKTSRQFIYYDSMCSTIYQSMLRNLAREFMADQGFAGKPLPKALKSYPDSSVAYLSKGTTDTSLQVVRFFGC
ncbi:hypothetical protein PC120_g23632 [Phytophthora cactorum]|nr:hypothetical protein PC120_g23632 [Phytophthora cactorum]